jgi:hypothetical protein
MTRLILTSGSGTPFMHSDFADLAIIFTYRFGWGPLPAGSPERNAEGEPGLRLMSLRCLRVFSDRRTRAHQIAVAVDVVDPAHWTPVFIGA